MNASLALVAALACGQTFTVTNKMPTSFVVVNKCQPCSLCDTCNCNGCECPALEAKLAKPAFVPKTKATAFSSPVVAKTTTTQTITTTRAAIGHSHTCPRCGTTWDHASNPGHNCPNCGTAVYTQDRSPRPVTVVRTIQVPVQTAPAFARTTQTVYETPVIFRSMQASSVAGGCANGSCSTATVTRRR